MRLAILATERQPQYLHLTLCSLLATGWREPVYVYHDSPMGDVLWPLEPYDQIKPVRYHGPRSHIANATAAMRDLASTGEDVLWAEDDVTFAVDWHGVLARMVSALGDALVSLFWCRVMEPVRPGLVLCPPDVFTGTQAIYLPAKHVAGLAAFLPSWTRFEFDLAVAAYAKQADVPIYITQPSIVQHWGRTSSIGSFYAISPTFQRKATWTG
jgi:hypothetical protein